MRPAVWVPPDRPDNEEAPPPLAVNAIEERSLGLARPDHELPGHRRSAGPQIAGVLLAVPAEHPDHAQPGAPEDLGRVEQVDLPAQPDHAVSRDAGALRE